MQHYIIVTLKVAEFLCKLPCKKKSAIPKDCAEDPPKEEVLEEYVQRAPNTGFIMRPAHTIRNR